MEVRVSVVRQVVVDGKVDAFDINASAENISSNTDTLVEFFEFFVTFDS
jgi:hypothetical protein